jgi:glycerate 2-kinase
MDPELFFTHSLRDERIRGILAAAIGAVEPGKLVRNALQYIPKTSGRIFALGLGKAALPMTEALAGSLALTKALVITKHAVRTKSNQITAIEGGHPIPDARSLLAGQAALRFVGQLEKDDLLICLISGGGSSLATSPVDGVNLDEMRALTSALLACGAPVEDINILRRQLDRVKGGGLAITTKAHVVGLILSDVIGNPLEAISSGPTAPNPTTSKDAIEILKKYSIKPPKRILRSLLSTQLVIDHLNKSRVQNLIIGDINTAGQAALNQAKREGFRTDIISLKIIGEAREIGLQMANQLKMATRKGQRPFCFIAGGETTVTLHGNGKGGRNQELALANVEALAGLQDVMLISLATDGEDGPTDAAGAVVNERTYHRGEEIGLSPSDYLSRNDAYSYFARLDDLLKPGPTGTNVNDLVFLIGL